MINIILPLNDPGSILPNNLLNNERSTAISNSLAVFYSFSKTSFIGSSTKSYSS